ARPVPAAPGKQRPLRKSVVERFATLTREGRSEARWREEVMLALSRQEEKTKEKESKLKQI
ncbi:MAG: hypothetical protein JW697_05245, partial [Kosmotogaceae bacterium]|nr:hypothetical protein [Kosmotogaceae bacterium]